MYRYDLLIPVPGISQITRLVLHLLEVNFLTDFLKSSYRNFVFFKIAFKKHNRLEENIFVL